MAAKTAHSLPLYIITNLIPTILNLYIKSTERVFFKKIPFDLHIIHGLYPDKIYLNQPVRVKVWVRFRVRES